MKQFEDYLKNNTEEENSFIPKRTLWNSIEAQLIRKKYSRVKTKLAIAASFIFLLASVATIMNKQTHIDEKESFSLSIYSDEFGEMETELKDAISQAFPLVENAQIPISTKSDFEIFSVEYQELEKQRILCIENIKTNGYDEFTGNELINIYALKLEILKSVLFEIDKMNSYLKKSHHETVKFKI